MYPNIQNFNQQTLDEKIDNEILRLQQIKNRNNTPAINQTFQLAPSNMSLIKYANSINDVQKDMVIGDTPYFSKDMSVVWIKNSKGEIRTYELTEIIPRDEKDVQIEFLQAQIDELKKGINNNEQHNTNVISAKNETNTSRINEEPRTTTKTNKSSSLQRISTSKK